MKKLLLVIIASLLLTAQINSKNIKITSPKGGDNWMIGGKNRNITWNAIGINNNIIITLWKDGNRKGVIARDVASSSGNYSWKVGKLIGGMTNSGTGYRIRFREKGDPTTYINRGDFQLSSANSQLVPRPPEPKFAVINKVGVVRTIKPDLRKMSNLKADGHIRTFSFTPIFADAAKSSIKGLDVNINIVSKNDFQIVDWDNNGVGTLYMAVFLTTWDASSESRPKSRNVRIGDFSVSGKNRMQKIAFNFNKNQLFKSGNNSLNMKINFKSPVKPIGIEEQIYYSKVSTIALKLIPNPTDFDNKMICSLLDPTITVKILFDTKNGTKQYLKTFVLQNKEMYYSVTRHENTSNTKFVSQGCGYAKKKWVPGKVGLL